LLKIILLADRSPKTIFIMEKDLKMTQEDPGDILSEASSDPDPGLSFPEFQPP